MSIVFLLRILATIATAADDDLRPATGAHVQAARGRLHWWFLQNAKEEESNKVDGPHEQCDTDGSHGCPAGRRAPCGYPLWRCGAGLDLAVEAGAAPVVFLRQTPFYHADGTPRCRARLQSPYEPPSPCPASTSRSRCVVTSGEFFFALASRRLYVTPPDLCGFRPGFRPPSTPSDPGAEAATRSLAVLIDLRTQSPSIDRNWSVAEHNA
jgi:hypothetical protein